MPSMLLPLHGCCRGHQEGPALHWRGGLSQSTSLSAAFCGSGDPLQGCTSSRVEVELGRQSETQASAA